MKPLVMALAFASAAFGADLDAIVAIQQKLLAARNSDKLPRDEVPLEEVAAAKGQLSSWAESRLQSFDRTVEPSDLTKTLTNELNGAIKQAPPDNLDRLGDFAVSFSRPRGEATWLQMNTDVGIPCGADRSVYLYEWNNDRWKRRFALEASDYRRSRYGPENFVDLQVSASDASGARLVLTAGSPPACMSVWHTLYIRLFRIDKAQTLLLEETPLANQGGDPSYAARLEPTGALIEFFGSSIDSLMLIRKHVLHYQLNHGAVERTEPIALTVRDFVEEWLTRPWTEIANWSDPRLAEWHAKLHKDNVFGEFDTAKRCARPGEWQISIDFDDRATYFSLLEQPVYHYTMLNISYDPRPDCLGRDELRNLATPTLFPKN
jgi:hypothetical protein